MGKALLMVVMLQLLIKAQLLYAQHDNNASSSVGWLRMPARNAMSDMADAAFYNPAGCIHLPEGWSISAGNLSQFRKPMHSFDLGLGDGEKTYGQAKADWFLPEISTVYRNGRLAGFASFNMAGVGINADYPNGSINTDMFSSSFLAIQNQLLDSLLSGNRLITDISDQSLHISSPYYTFSMGAAFMVYEKLSFSGGLRYIYANRKEKIHANVVINPLVLLLIPAGLFPGSELNLNVEDKSSGFGFQIGSHLKINERLNVSAHFDSRIKLDFTREVLENDFQFITGNLALYVDGQRYRRDLPAQMALGASYRFTDRLLLSADCNFYFQKLADWDTVNIEGQRYKWADLAGNASRHGIAASWDWNKKLQISGGFSFSLLSYPDEKARERYYTGGGVVEMIKDNNLLMGCGLIYRYSNCLSFSAAASNTLYFNKDVKSLTASNLMSVLANQDKEIGLELWNRITGFGLGVVIRLLPSERVMLQI